MEPDLAAIGEPVSMVGVGGYNEQPRTGGDMLRTRDWTGTRVVELQGAGEISYDEVAACLSEVLGLQLTHVTIPPEQAVQAMTGMGFSRVLAESFVELADALATGRMVFHEPRSAANTTPTAYPEFAQLVYKPAFEAAASQDRTP